MKRDLHNRKYIEEDNIRFYDCAKLYLKKKELIFYKNLGAKIRIIYYRNYSTRFFENKSESFIFTPDFGIFIGYQNLFKYINDVWLPKKNLYQHELELKVDWQKELLFKIDTDKLILGDLWISDLEEKIISYKFISGEWIQITEKNKDFF